MSDLSGTWPGPTVISGSWTSSGAVTLPTTFIVEGDSYRHDQSTTATVWIVDHQLGRYPSSVTVYDPTLAQQYDEFEVLHLSTEQLRISMDLSIPGVAIVG
jgi:hypothetical protein